MTGFINLVGFERGNRETWGYGAPGGTASISATSPITGSNSFLANPVTTAVGYIDIGGYADTDASVYGIFPSLTQLEWSFKFKPETVPASLSEEILVVIVTTGPEFQLRLTSTGFLAVYSSGTLDSTATLKQMVANGIYTIEVRMGTDASAPWAVWVDGVQVLSGTKAWGSGSASVQRIRFGKANNRNGQTVAFKYDDIAIRNDNTWIGQGECRTFFANAAPSSFAQAWTNGTGATFAEVDEIGQDDADTTYWAKTTAGANDHGASLQNMSGGGIRNVACVMPWAIVRTDGATNNLIALRWAQSGVGGNSATAIMLTSAYQSLAMFKYLDILDAPFTPTFFDALEVGVLSSSPTTFTLGRCTQVGATIYAQPQFGQETIAGTSTLAGTGTYVQLGQDTIAGQGAVTPTGRMVTAGQCTIAGQATVAPTGSKVVTAQATIAGQATVTPTAFAGQSVYPIADVSNAGVWVNEVGATTGLYASIDETVLNTADYAQSPASPVSGASVVFRLAPMNAPPLGSAGTILIQVVKV